MPKEYENSPEYLAKKRYYSQFLTVYGKKTILDILTDSPDVEFAKILIAEKVKGDLIDQIVAIAKQRKITIEFTTPERISRISKNKNQDQGIVADIRTPSYASLADFLAQAKHGFALIALDGVTTVENVGMIIRSVAASGVDGLLIPKKGCPNINQPLVIKASAGTIFKTIIINCEELSDALRELKESGVAICSLAAGGQVDLFSHQPTRSTVYVLGNEATGISPQTAQMTDTIISIPMANRVESLNVAAAATLVAYQAGRAHKSMGLNTR
ncbi:MAG: TrmH family RNA methyltransferase [Bacillota bacterium]